VSFDLANLIDCIQVQQLSPGVFEGRNLDLDYHRVFGGQLLAQTVSALTDSGDGKVVKSLVQHFPREGNTASPVQYDVTVHQAGRTFATMGVRLSQGDKTISAAAAQLHAPESGLESNPPMPSVAGPDEAEPLEIGMIPWELRVIDGVDLGTRDSLAAKFQFWMRLGDHPSAAVADNDWTHQALLAHATDLTVIGTALLPIDGISQNDTGKLIHTAVTSHSIWFHQPFRLNDWVLVDQSGPVLSGGRAFGRGDVWTIDGRLVASFAQESMVRLLPPAQN
jgi:acyl-CoA thioesterase II